MANIDFDKDANAKNKPIIIKVMDSDTGTRDDTLGELYIHDWALCVNNPGKFMFNKEI